MESWRGGLKVMESDKVQSRVSHHTSVTLQIPVTLKETQAVYSTKQQ